MGRAGEIDEEQKGWLKDLIIDQDATVMYLVGVLP